jgi:glycosyltransferase involved in cell wall biosynthesis
VVELSVVIPVFNEEDSLEALWAELRPVLEALGRPFEVIFVDDGSQDRSAEIVRGLHDADRRARLVRLKANAGETAAQVVGFQAARGRWVVTMDADLQNDPADIPRLLAQLDQWDAVTGWRVDRAAGDGLVRRLTSRVANGVRNRLSGESIHDSGCTFRAFRRECLRELPPYRGLHRFIPTLLRMQGYRVIELPVRHRPRRFGHSKYGVMNRAFVALADLLAVRWMHSRRLHYQIAEDLGGDLLRE